MKKSYLSLTLLLTLCLPCGLQALAADQSAVSAHPTHDIRVLVDVSGSMKKNDPGNLRAPALRLLTGLLPSGTHAGVWTFGRYVNMLVPYGEVNTSWRGQAMLAADRINSAGLYTDIEAALETATWNWTAPAPGVRRSIILLTDGLVDVPNSADSDRQSRARITEKLLPRLQRAGTVVYSIALSAGADEALLQQMAAATGGWFERADNADRLERIFLRMFEKAANPDTLPLVDNKVLVDDSINELTLLVFRKENAPPTTVTMPDGVSFGMEQLPPNARWHKDAHYDLVTIKKPMTGTWHVNADIDPDNRVMVVTNLRVVATQLPNQVLAGDAHEIFVRFTEKGHAIAEKEFLHFLKVRVLQNPVHGGKSDWLLLDNGRDGDLAAGDGIYSLQLGKTLETGRHTFTVDVDGTTFKRQHQQEVEVVASPVIAEIRPEGAGETLLVVPRVGIIDPETLEATATVTGDDVLSDTHTLTRSGPNEWRLALDNYPPDASYQVTLDIAGQRPSGKPISYHGEPMNFGRAAVTSPAQQEEAAPQEPSVNADTEAEPADEDVDEAVTDDSTSEEAEEAEHTNWLLVISLVVIMNLLMAGGLFLGYRKLFGAKETPADSEQSMADEQQPAAAVSPAAGPHATQPSVVQQVVDAAASDANTAATSSDDSLNAQEDVPMEMEIAPPEVFDEITLEQAEAGEAAPEPDTDPQETAGFSPELVMEDTSSQDAPDVIDEQLKSLDVDEINLGFEQKTRNTG